MGKLEYFSPTMGSVFSMTPKIKNYLHDLISLSKNSGASLYLVGGTVRDSLLERNFSENSRASGTAWEEVKS